MTEFARRGVLLGGAAAALAPALVPALARGQGAPDPLAAVDPELRPMLRSNRGRAVAADMTLADMQAPARRAALGAPLPPPAPQPVEQKVPGPRGAPEVRVLVVKPAGASGPRPAYLYIHGGGYVMGRADQGVRQLQELARDHGIFGVSVDYRLAPETAYPGSLEDNYAVLKWLHGHAAELDVDPDRIAIGGASAGGGHAAALAIAARDRREVPLRFQVLIYPMVDDRTASTRPARPGVGHFIWTPADNRVGWRALLGHAPGVGEPPPTAAPARLKDFRGLPPAFVGVGDIDLFCDEDIEYARRLVAAGVPTELVVVPGAFHAFDSIAPQSAAARMFRGEWERLLVRALGA
jgi:acetyl esterase/lipase